jgi:hypothetical protein
MRYYVPFFLLCRVPVPKSIFFLLDVCLLKQAVFALCLDGCFLGFAVFAKRIGTVHGGSSVDAFTKIFGRLHNECCLFQWLPWNSFFSIVVLYF